MDNYCPMDYSVAKQWSEAGRDGKHDWTACDVWSWRKKNGYTWHQRNDMKSCDLVPTAVKASFSGLGGRGERRKNGDGEYGYEKSEWHQMVLWDNPLLMDVEVAFSPYIEPVPLEKEAYDRFMGQAKELIETAKRPIQEFCLKQDQERLEGIDIGDMYQYVRPDSIYIDCPHQGETDRVVALVCEYRFSMESDVVAVFRNEQLEKVCWDFEFL